MRGVHLTILATAALLAGSLASAQGLGDVAVQEKQKRQAQPDNDSKVYTEEDLGPSMTPAPLPETLPGSADADKEASAEGSGEAGGKAEGASADEQRAQAQEAWRRQLEQARKESDIYQDVIDKLQLELNDTSGGVYNPGRASKIAFLEENKQLLAQTQQRIADLEEEGRRNDYR